MKIDEIDNGFMLPLKNLSNETQVYYALTHEQATDVEIRDLLGNIKYAKRNLSAKEQLNINCQGWTSGVYVVNLLQNGEVIKQEKLIIK